MGEVDRKAGHPSRRDVLIQGARLLPYVVPAVTTVLAGSAEAHHQPEHRSCPPGFVEQKGQCIPPQKSGGGDGSGLPGG